MNYTILHVGDFKEAYWAAAWAEYQKRMRAYGSFEGVSLKCAKTPGRQLSAEEAAATLEAEAREFEKALSVPRLAKSYKIALCVEGKSLSSEELAQLVEKVALRGANSITFLVGSSWGIAARIKETCDASLSFSPMTFPHDLARVMLAEQLYRAEAILHKTGYHK